LSQGNATAIPFATILQECAFVLSPWLSLRSGFALAIAAVLMAACVAGGSQGSRSAPVLKGALNMGVPAGYCIDRAASREAQDSAVVIMGRCADNVKALPAVLTVSVGQAGTAGAMAAGGQALASFFTSEEGRATLSRDGRASSVQVVEALSSGDAFLMHLSDAQEGGYWRAILGLSGRLITVSVTGSPDLPLAPEDGRKVLDKAVAAMQAANKG
jgi:hypothetical protein